MVSRRWFLRALGLAPVACAAPIAAPAPCEDVVSFALTPVDDAQAWIDKQAPAIARILRERGYGDERL